MKYGAYIHMVENDVAVKNNADLYVMIQKDYLIIMLPGKKSHSTMKLFHLIWIYMCLYTYMYICTAHVCLLICGEKSIISKCDLMVVCIREKVVFLKIEILRPCVEPSKSESWSEAWKPLFVTSSSVDSYPTLMFGLVANSSELIIFLVVVCS